MSNDRLLGQIVAGERPGDTVIRLAGRLADPSIDGEELESWVDWLAELGQRMNDCDIKYSSNQCTEQCDGVKRCGLEYGHTGDCDPYGWITDRAPTADDAVESCNQCVEVEYTNGLVGWEQVWDLGTWKCSDGDVVAWRKIRPGKLRCNGCQNRLRYCTCEASEES